MKTFLKVFILSIIGSTAGSASGQGQFYLANWGFEDSQIVLDAPVFDADGNRLQGTNYLAMLFGGPTINSLSPAVYDSGVQAVPITFTFYLSGLPGYFFGDEAVRIPGVVGGTPAWLQVVAWDARLGGTYQDVVNLGVGGYGQSTLFQAISGGGGVNPGPPRDLFGLQSFSLLPVVPEPGAVWLLLLGLPLLFWRKRFSK